MKMLPSNNGNTAAAWGGRSAKGLFTSPPAMQPSSRPRSATAPCAGIAAQTPGFAGMATAKELEKITTASAWQARKERFNHGAGVIVNGEPGEKLKRVLSAQGAKTTHEIEAVGRDSATGLYVYIQNAGMKGGMYHVVGRHVEEFHRVGAQSNAQIRELVLHAVTTGKHIATQGQNRPVYATQYQGREVRVAVSVSACGYVIGANISKPSDRTRAPQARWNTLQKK